MTSEPALMPPPSHVGGGVVLKELTQKIPAEYAVYGVRRRYVSCYIQYHRVGVHASVLNGTISSR